MSTDSKFRFIEQFEAVVHQSILLEQTLIKWRLPKENPFEAAYHTNKSEFNFHRVILSASEESLLAL